MNFSRLFTTWDSVVVVGLATVTMYVAVVVCTRVAGPRSLATMSSFDIAATVAVGSTVATAASLDTPVAHAVVTLVVLYVAQAAAALLRRKRRINRFLDNSPLLLMAGTEILADNLRQARLTEPELWSQLRRAGVVRRAEVLAVVLETTGEVSVLKGDSHSDLDRVLLLGVRGADRLPTEDRG